MAEGARQAARADVAVAISGIAGPGGSEFKPEGRVCYALADTSGTRSETIRSMALWAISFFSRSYANVDF